MSTLHWSRPCSSKQANDRDFSYEDPDPAEIIAVTVAIATDFDDNSIGCVFIRGVAA